MSENLSFAWTQLTTVQKYSQVGQTLRCHLSRHQLLICWQEHCTGKKPTYSWNAHKTGDSGFATPGLHGPRHIVGSQLGVVVVVLLLL